MAQSVSNLVARSLLALLQEQGLETSKILSLSGISRHELDKKEGRLSAPQHLRVLQEIGVYQELILNGLLEQNINNGIASEVYHYFPEFIGACLNQENGTNLLQTYRHYRIVVGDCDHIIISRNDSHTRVEYVVDGPRQRNFSALGNFMLMFDCLRNSIPDLRGQIWLEAERDAADSAIDAFFRQSCHFGQHQNVLLLENAQLDSPSGCFNRLLNRGQMAELQRCCQQIAPPPSFCSLVSELIDQALAQAETAGETHILPQICALLGMSRWTLNERLRPFHTSFTELLKQRRMALACRLLAETNQSILQISERVCFSSQAVFSRFFSSHLGMTPLAYRQRYSH